MAADKAPGLVWISGLYARHLRSSRGRQGLDRNASCDCWGRRRHRGSDCTRNSGNPMSSIRGGLLRR